MKNIAILGSTGSVGKNTLEVIRHFPDDFRVAALSTNANINTLQSQLREFKPRFICVNDQEAARRIENGINSKTRLFVGEDGLGEMMQQEGIDKVVLAISGSSALTPLLKAIENRREIALANKEALVMAGPIIMEEAIKKNVKILPIDSEQSAIWQCLAGADREKLKYIYLTASGGPLRNTPRSELKNVSVKGVLKHPRWKMGKKITIDSASLMNKGLELLETMFLFNVSPDKIKIVIHPEAIIHSMVEFVDGVVLAQLSATDMRIPIQYALSYPERFSNSLPIIDFYKLKALHFEKPDLKQFPCLLLAYRAARELGTMPAVLNAANEVSVEQFLRRSLGFISIPKVIRLVLDKHRNKKEPDLNDILAADAWARNESYSIIERLRG